MNKSFSKWKEQRLASADLSKKGSIDSSIRRIVTHINSLDQFFTTSSCSGRIILFTESKAGNHGPAKKGCDWLLVSHVPVELEQVMEAVESAEGNLVMKFEAFVLHVQCRGIEDAQLLHEAAVASGHRNSGITVGKNGKIIAALRSTHGLEVPLSENGKMFASREYLDFLLRMANSKMEESFRRIERFEKCFEELIRSKQSSIRVAQSSTENLSRSRPVCKATQTAPEDLTDLCDVKNMMETDSESLDLFDEVT